METQINLEQISQYAKDCHSGTNHLYDGKPYSTHLDMVVNTTRKFSYLLPDYALEMVEAAAWCHDLIEDCRETYNDVRNKTCTTVADIVYALTNEKGKNRKERANDKYYQGIKDTEFATFIKICDRIANIKYSKSTNSIMIELYRKEAGAFNAALYDSKYHDMFMHMRNMLS